MRVFSAALATETNTFAPMPTGLSRFHERAYYPAGQHPDRMQMHSGPLWAARLAPDKWGTAAYRLRSIAPQAAVGLAGGQG